MREKKLFLRGNPLSKKDFMHIILGRTDIKLHPDHVVVPELLYTIAGALVPDDVVLRLALKRLGVPLSETLIILRPAKKRDPLDIDKSYIYKITRR